MDAPETLNVECPCCRAKLTVDAASGEVLMHKEPRSQTTIDIIEAAHSIQEKAKHRDEEFQKSLDAERRRGETLDKKFLEALKRAKETPDDGKRPLRDIDLD